MKMTLDEFVEGFISLLVILVIASATIEIIFGIDISDLITQAIELLIPAFIGGFIALLIVQVLQDLM